MNDIAHIEVPSKSSVHKAGSILRKVDASSEELEQALVTLSRWRALHSYPINTFQAYLRLKVKKSDYDDPIIAQRLKRLPSIIQKLKRYPRMGLETMQDIGGLRVILKDVSAVYNLYSSLSKSRFKHIPLLPPNDYIKKPKPDGYRSLHQVYKYINNNHPELNILHIEIQIRTRLQHAWATAVETLGIVEKSSFKTGEGDEKFKTFFKLSSALFSMDEKQPVLEEYRDHTHEEIVRELKELENDLQITSKLQGLALTAKQIESNSTNYSGYHLMHLDTRKNKISILNFSRQQLEFAENVYASQEQANKNNPDVSIVLIAANSIREIKKAYPNYFLDTNDFVKHLMRMMNE
ncbi:RelA/SpoT domain-containing protein [Mailhella massiliensis]|uniref:RelA/SpoT domain-containing protein n=1 Tax=Mailhella massiliensis TaxID=1903261 RepID=UPI00097D64E9|nr:RelA/SpoT domain-containing protein [Mailhella massiliensis]